LVEPLRGQEDVAAVAVHQRPSAEVADDETDVIADDGGDHRDDEHGGDVHVTRTGEDGRRDQDGLPGQRDAHK
jgi:hypothetical protein